MNSSESYQAHGDSDDARSAKLEEENQSKVNFEKARLSQAEADQMVQGDTKYRDEDRENTSYTPGEGRVMLKRGSART